MNQENIEYRLSLIGTVAPLRKVVEYKKLCCLPSICTRNSCVLLSYNGNAYMVEIPNVFERMSKSVRDLPPIYGYSYNIETSYGIPQTIICACWEENGSYRISRNNIHPITDCILTTNSIFQAALYNEAGFCEQHSDY